MSREYVLHSFAAPVSLRIDYARELNPQQLVAVTAPPGPALVIAGAGAGKTRTLTYRVAYLLEQGVRPDRILLLTFTNKAAQEMMRRVAGLLGGEVSALWGGTFHAIGNRLLRRHAEQAGYKPDFTILDREDARHLLSACLAAADIDVKETRFPKAEVLSDLYSLMTNTHKSMAEVLSDHYPYFRHLEEPIQKLHTQYQARKRAANVMDFDDLLARWLQLLQQQAELRERYQHQFQFILVDEYQDTNQLQCDLIDLLAARHHNLMVVGDDAQSIYAWRGANFRNILEFPKRYPEAAIYKIETNYRSTPEVLALANAAIAANVNQFAKQLAPARKSGPKPVLVACQDGYQQATFVAQRMLELREEGDALNRMAVLYRSHFHAMELQMELTRRNIPFSITSGVRFFEQAHIKDVIAYLRLVCNPNDELAFTRIVRLLPGIGGKGSDKLWLAFQAAVAGQMAKSQGLLRITKAPETEPQSAETGPSPRPALEPGHSGREDAPVDESAIPASPEDGPKPQSEIHPCLAAALNACRELVPKKAVPCWPQLIKTIAQLEAQPIRGQPSEMIELVLEAGYQEYLQTTYENFMSRREDLTQLASFALQFRSLEEFLAQLSLLSNLDAEDHTTRRSDEERIRLSTIHQAKGLEFDVVFIIMLCDGLFPTVQALDQMDKLEEERRLFYVAITRARNELYLSYPYIRMARGSGANKFQAPSRFLDEIPEGLWEQWNVKPADAGH